MAREKGKPNLRRSLGVQKAEEATNPRKRERRLLEEVRRSQRENQALRPQRRAPPQGELPPLPDERCTGKEFPSGNFSAGRTVRSAVRGRWSGRNRRQRCRRREGKYLRRGIGLLRHGLERPNNGPCNECPNGQFHGQ